MRRNTLRLLAFTSAVALGATLSSNSFAQTETVNATMTLTSAITTVHVSDMDFGSWVAQIGTADDAANDVIITLTNGGTPASTVAGVTDSTVLQTAAPLTEGVVTVETPAGAVLTMTRSGTSDFADTNISLTAVAYRTATEGPNALNADNATGNVTVVAANTAETVTFGGDITFTATAADGVHPASFDVTFSY